MDVKTKQDALYKRVLSAILALAVLLLALPAMSFAARAAATSEFSGGTGTKEDPYLISKVDDLKQLATDVNSTVGDTYSNKFFRMTGDIDLENEPWTPIGGNSTNATTTRERFAGTFDGGGHEIKGLNVSDEKSFAGLFGIISSSGTVMNLTVSGSVSGGTYYSGGIVAYNNLGTIANCVNKCNVAPTNRSGHIGGIAGYNSGTISNCRNEGTINGTNHNAGGIAGWSITNSERLAVIENSWNEGEVSIKATSINNFVGGIVGDLQGGSLNFNGSPNIVKNCYNVADISNTGTSEDNSIGGIAGVSRWGLIENCYNIGGLSNNGDGTVGGIAGELKKGEATPEVTSCYYTAGNGCGKIDEDSIITDLTKVTSDQLKEESTFKGWDFNKTWKIRSSLGRPVLLTLTSERLFEGNGTANDPYVIDTAETLQGFAQLVNGGNSFEGKFIELTNDIDLLKEGVCGKNIGSWTPIGKDKAFKGTFDGKGHKILNLYINDGTEDNAGLFGINDGTIKDLAVTGTVTGGSKAGGIVGTNRSNGKIESCSNACNVTGTSEVGGIAGLNDGGAIDNCYNTGDITGDSKVGGVSGYNDGGTVKNSYNIGDISGNTNAGGVAGSNNNGTVENCYYLGSAEDGSGNGTPKTESEFKSGEVAFLLQSKQTKQVWGQKLTGNDKDDHPVLTGDTDTKVVKFPYDCTDSSGNDLTIYTNPPETTADLPAGTTVKLGDAEVTVTNGGTVQGKDGGKMYFPQGSVAKKNGQTSNAPTGGGVYDPASGTWENGSLDDPSDNPGSGSGGSTGILPPSSVIIPSTGNNNDPSKGDNTGSSDGISADDINVGSSGSENGIEVTIGKDSVGTLKNEVIASHLTDKDKAAIKDGNKLDVILSAEDAADSVSDADKQAAEAVLDGTGYTFGRYLNIDLLKQINGEEVGKITELNSPITLVFVIPEELRKENRVFGIVRIHDGEAKFFKDTDNDPDTITIVTDRFSTYIIVYKDLDAPNSDNPNTGMATPIAVAGLACAIGVTAVIVKKKKLS